MIDSWDWLLIGPVCQQHLDSVAQLHGHDQAHELEERWVVSEHSVVRLFPVSACQMSKEQKTENEWNEWRFRAELKERRGGTRRDEEGRTCDLWPVTTQRKVNSTETSAEFQGERNKLQNMFWAVSSGHREEAQIKGGASQGKTRNRLQNASHRQSTDFVFFLFFCHSWSLEGTELNICKK